MQTDSSLPISTQSHTWNKWILFVVLAGVVLILDQVTKRKSHLHRARFFVRQVL